MRLVLFGCWFFVVFSFPCRWCLQLKTKKKEKKKKNKFFPPIKTQTVAPFIVPAVPRGFSLGRWAGEGDGGIPGRSALPGWREKSITACRGCVTLTPSPSHLLPFGERLVFLSAKTSRVPCLISQRGNQCIVGAFFFFPLCIWYHHMVNIRFLCFSASEKKKKVLYFLKLRLVRVCLVAAPWQTCSKQLAKFGSKKKNLNSGRP